MTLPRNQKTVLITGANSGIGKAAAVQLARAGATVVMACRNPERGARAVNEVRAASGNARVELLGVDMASQASICRFAQEFTGSHARLDVLIHNAATFDHRLKEPVLTQDGLETVIATNHLGPFLMTGLLLDLLKASAPSRIITVASKGLIAYPFLDIEFDNLNGERRFSMQHAYYHSKQAQVMFTFDLAERLQGTGVTVNCVRVGNIAIPDERLAHLPAWMRKAYHAKRKFALTPEKMAETYTWLAVDPALGTVTGGYWDAPNVPARANRMAYNKHTWKKLWDVSAALTHISNHS
ncbi:MAG: SDR family NAD(P)-dependent oxidoreductase [Anaerolineales bacterium]|nr:SDR family NAD(P)-dependent oxidoreductase [Anaerolineales bacterium]